MGRVSVAGPREQQVQLRGWQPAEPLGRDSRDRAAPWTVQMCQRVAFCSRSGWGVVKAQECGLSEG